MSRIRTTRHAQKRMQQRGISELQARLINEFGADMYQKGGESYRYLPAKEIAALRYAIDKIESVRLITGDHDQLVTAMHATRKVRTTCYAA